MKCAGLRLVAAVLLGGVLWLAPAQTRAGDWDFASFGMTVDEVAAASSGRAQPCKDKMEKWCRFHSPGYAWTALWMTTKVGDTNLILIFNFDDQSKRLTEVSVRSGLIDIGNGDIGAKPNFSLNTGIIPGDDRWFDGMLNELRQKYGSEKPDRVGTVDTLKWKSEQGEIWASAPVRPYSGGTIRYVSWAGIAAMRQKPFDPDWPPTVLYRDTPLTVTRSEDASFCGSFLGAQAQGLEPMQGGGTQVLPISSEPQGTDDVMSVQVDLDNDGAWDIVHWVRGGSPYFTGDYLIVVPREAGPATIAATQPRGDRSVEEYLDGLRQAGGTVYSGAATLYAAERDVRFLLIRRDEKIYLWAWPVKGDRHPLALLYRPAANGKLDLACAFDRAP